MIKRILIFLPAVFLLLSGCKTFKGVSAGRTGTADLQKVIAGRLNESFDPEFLLVENADFEISGDNSAKAKITLYMEKNRNIFFAVKYMGFEIARGEITEDSIKFINRFKREYYYGSSNDLRNYLPADFDLGTLQKFIYTGLFYKNERKKDFIRKFVVDSARVSFNEILNEGQKIQLYYDRFSLKLERIYLSDYIHDVLADVEIAREETEPRNFTISLITGKEEREVNIRIRDIKYRNYERTEFKTGKNYTKLERLF